MSLAAAVKLALSRNPSVAVATEDIRRAEAVVREVRAAFLPTLTGNAAYTRLDSDRGANGVVFASASSLSANVTLAVPLLAPRSWAQTSHAGDAVDVARGAEGEVRRQLAIAVGRAYLAVIAQRRTIEANQLARDAAKAHLDFAHARLVGGVGNRLDEVRAAQELASTEAVVQTGFAGLVRAREALAVLVGSDTPVDAEGEPDLGEPAQGAEALDEARARRADVRLLEARVRSAERVERDNWTDYAPAVTGYFQPFYQTPATLAVPQTGWQLQFALVVPLYDGGLRYGLADERKAITAQSRDNLDLTVRQIRSDLRAAQEALRRAMAAQAASRDAGKLAVEAIDLANIAYHAGATTNIEVIDAERRARDAATVAAVAEDGARQARLDLLIAAGRFP